MQAPNRFEVAAWMIVIAGIALAAWRPLWPKPPNAFETSVIYTLLGFAAALTGAGLIVLRAARMGRVWVLASFVLLPVLVCLLLTLIGPAAAEFGLVANDGNCVPVKLPGGQPGYRCGPAPAPADEGAGPLITDTYLDLDPLPLLWHLDRQVEH
jgi:hypothetical protein